MSIDLFKLNAYKVCIFNIFTTDVYLTGLTASNQ